MISPVSDIVGMLSNSGFDAVVKQEKTFPVIEATKKDDGFSFLLEIFFSKKPSAVLNVKKEYRTKYIVENDDLINKLLETLQKSNYKDYVCHGTIKSR